MASLLCPVTLESCQTSLRDRRRSSFNSINSIPRLFSSTLSRDDSALVDDDQSEGPSPSPTGSLPPLSPLVNAQLPDHASSIIILRHGDEVPVISTDVYDMSSLPYNIPLDTTLESPQKSSLSVGGEDDCIMERVRWRLASGFFAYFLLGWGDGGQ